MKRLCIIIGAAILAFACTSTKKETDCNITVFMQGDSTDFRADSLVVTNANGEDLIEFTTAIVNGKAEFSLGKLDTPEYFYIHFNGDSQNPINRVFAENSNIVINLDLKNPAEAIIEGSKTHRIIDSLNKEKDAFLNANNVESLVKKYRMKETTDKEKEKILAIYDSLIAITDKMDANFIASNPKSYYALYTLKSKIDNLNAAEAEKALDPFLQDSIEFKNNRIVLELNKTINIIKSLEPGNKAPDFEQATPDGKLIKLSDVYPKHKITMIDFWASWCKPCRAFNPILVNLYKKYNKKGFGILGVSFDENIDKWKEAIKDDKLTWFHVSDLKGWRNEAGVPYMVKFIPQNVLVDENGLIIKRRASEEELEQILSERLK